MVARSWTPPSSLPQFHQKQEEREGLRDASDQEWQPAALRHEKPRRRREGSDLVHTIVNTAASVGDVAKTGELTRKRRREGVRRLRLHGRQKAPRNSGRREEVRGDLPHQPQEGHRKGQVGQGIESRKSSVRSKVEHPFLIVKRYFGLCKAVCKGLRKNGSPSSPCSPPPAFSCAHAPASSAGVMPGSSASR